MRRISLLLLLCFFMTAAVSLSEVTFIDVPPAPAEGADQSAIEPSSSPLAEGAVEILITAAGDVTFGGNMRKNPASTMYTKWVDQHNGDLSFFFANVQDIFSQDDMTLVNFEGVLTENTQHKDNPFIFRAPPDHVRALTLGSIEAVSLENNHVMDFYQAGYDDTVKALQSESIVYASDGRMGLFTVKGVTIAMLAYQTFDGAYPRLLEQVPQDIETAKAAGDIVIVSYHWGVEEDYAPNEKQINLGHATIDAGADLVLGHHSHRANPIELYNGKYIVYSLGNCSFSGNTSPRDMDTFLYQQKFTVENGVTTPGPFRVIPASISSLSGTSGKERADNDLIVTPFPEGTPGIQRVLDKLKENGKKLAYGVESYPTEWQ